MNKQTSAFGVGVTYLYTRVFSGPQGMDKITSMLFVFIGNKSNIMENAENPIKSKQNDNVITMEKKSD